MRVVLFANGEVGRRVGEFLADDESGEVVAVVTHAPGVARELDAIRAAAPGALQLTAEALRTEEGRSALASTRPQLGVSAFFGHLLRADVLELFDRGVVNVHPALLPWNRGAHPNVWSIVEGTPSGVTLHWVDEGLDTGPVVAQREVPVRPDDTARTLYLRLEDACAALVRDTWPALVAGTAGHREQEGEGSFHRAAELATLDRMDLDATCTGAEWLDRIRARTFPPHSGVWFERDGRRVQVRVQLEDLGPADAEGDAR